MEDTGSEVGRVLMVADLSLRGLPGMVRLVDPAQKPDSRMDRGLVDDLVVAYDLVGLVAELSSAAVTGPGVREEPRTLLPDRQRRTR